MLLFLLPFLAAADGGIPSDAATRLPTQACPEVGLAAMLSSALLGQGGIQTLDLKGPDTSLSGTEFRVRSFRSARRVAVQLELPGTVSLPGKVTKASFSSPKHQSLRVLEVIEVAPDSEDARGRLIVEAEAQPREARGVYTLELQDAEGTRLLVVPGVRFPPL